MILKISRIIYTDYDIRHTLNVIMAIYTLDDINSWPITLEVLYYTYWLDFYHST